MEIEKVVNESNIWMSGGIDIAKRKVVRVIKSMRKRMERTTD